MLGISGLGAADAIGASGIYAASARRVAANPAAGTLRTAALPSAQPNVPVQPVSPAPAVAEVDSGDLLRRWENDPAALSARSRIQYAGDEQANRAVWASDADQTAEQAETPGLDGSANLPGTIQLSRSRGMLRLDRADTQGVNLPGFADADATVLEGEAPGETQGAEDDETESAREVMEESECQTCKRRKYQDGSDDPGVSFKTPTRVSPEEAASAVRGHEQEHVAREQASAQREGRRVVSQSVTYQTAICPECGRVYVSGGTTRTTTVADPEEASAAPAVGEEKDGDEDQFGVPEEKDGDEDQFGVPEEKDGAGERANVPGLTREKNEDEEGQAALSRLLGSNR